MRNRYHIILQSALLILFFSNCVSKNKETIVKAFPVNDNLVANTIKVPVNLLMPYKILATDQNLIIYDFQKEEMFKIFELPSIHYLFSWGNIGKGPDEIKNIDFNSIKGYHNWFVFLDFLKFKTAIIKDDSIKIIKTQWIKQQAQPINGLLMVNDSMFIFNAASNNKFEHTALNINNDKSFDFGKVNDKLDIKNFNKREQTYLKKTVVKPDGKKIAAFYVWFNKFKLFDNEYNLIKEVVIKDEYSVKPYSLEDNKENIIYNMELFATDNYIFVLNPYYSEKKGLINKYPSLSVWDWEGNPIAKYKFDKQVSSFTVSEKYHKIFTIYMEDMNDINVYEIPTILRKQL